MPTIVASRREEGRIKRKLFPYVPLAVYTNRILQSDLLRARMDYHIPPVGSPSTS